MSTTGDEVAFRDARQLAQYLAGSEDVQRAFVVQLFEYSAKQPIQAYGEGVTDRLVAYFRDHDYDIKALFAEIAVTIAMHEG